MLKKLGGLERRFQRGEGGFTLIELLIAIVILGILIAVIVPNITTYLSSGNLAAANNEASMVQASVLSFMADNSGTTPADVAALAPYVQGNVKGSYTWDGTSGMLDTTCTYPDLAGYPFDGVRFTKP